MNRLRILQLFNRYENYGGEEGSVYRIGDAMQELYDVEYFITSTKDFLKTTALGKFLLPARALRNNEVVTRLRHLQRVGRFHAWQAHNVFPTMSPAVYKLAFDLGVPIIHFLHSYRLSCTNGFFLNHGAPCQRCINGNFWPAFQTACWRDNHLVSGMMGLVLRRVRNLGVFDQVWRWIAISEAQKDEHIKMGLPAERIEVIHHFYETKEPPPPPGNGKTALFIGRLSPEKGVSQLLDAWKMLGRADAKLIIAGDGPERAALEAKAARLNLRNVEFTGFAEPTEQRALWARAAFGVAPSTWLEPFGMVVLEAWANARPVLGSTHGAFPELIDEGRTGWLAPPSNPAAFAGALATMFDRPRDTEAMGQAGLQELNTRFTRAVWLEKIQRLYRRLDVHPTRFANRNHPTAVPP
ncbi:MAG: glycosyltransferase family 4 protein [Verrucomicrobia bacterium]|nr:glycosyltransferase family 4 protein [Verrucomicrobiota bacterium]